MNKKCFSLSSANKMCIKVTNYDRISTTVVIKIEKLIDDGHIKDLKGNLPPEPNE